MRIIVALAAAVGLVAPTSASAADVSTRDAFVRSAESMRYVQRDGAQLTSGGVPWRFVGINVYNANSRVTCWYPMHHAQIGDAIGASGASVMRAWFFQSELLTPNGSGVWDWSAFDETLASARALGVRVVAVLADHWGACEGGGRKDESWYRDGYRTATPTSAAGFTEAPYRDYVAAVVARYADDPTIAAWQLINEPEAPTAAGVCAPSAGATLQSFAADMAGVVRSIDERHLVTIGTIGTGQCGTVGDDYSNLIRAGRFDWCEAHDYGDGDHKLADRIAECDALGLPMVIGEAGLSIDEAGSAQRRADDLGMHIDAAHAWGVDGYLPWGWADPPAEYGGADQFSITPGDPALDVIRNRAERWATKTAPPTASALRDNSTVIGASGISGVGSSTVHVGAVKNPIADVVERPEVSTTETRGE